MCVSSAIPKTCCFAKGVLAKNAQRHGQCCLYTRSNAIKCMIECVVDDHLSRMIMHCHVLLSIIAHYHASSRIDMYYLVLSCIIVCCRTFSRAVVCRIIARSSVLQCIAISCIVVYDRVLLCIVAHHCARSRIIMHYRVL